MGDIRVITFAWGSYNWLIEPFLVSLERHWDGSLPDVTVMSDVPLHNVDAQWFPLRVGWRPGLFSDRLRDVLRVTSEPVVVVSCPDRFVIGNIPGDSILSLAEYMADRTDIVRCGLASIPSLDGHHTHLETWKGLDIVQCSDNRHCSLANGICIDMSLFNRDTLYNTLELFWTPWKVEVYGTKNVLANPDIRSVSVHPGLFKTFDVARTMGGRSVVRYPHTFLDEEDTRLVVEHAPSGIEWI